MPKRKDILYSHVYERETTTQWRNKHLRDDWRDVATTETRWMEATPVEDAPDLYTVKECWHEEFHHKGFLTRLINTCSSDDSYSDCSSPSDYMTTHMSGADALTVIARREKEWEQDGLVLAKCQPSPGNLAETVFKSAAPQ